MAPPIPTEQISQFDNLAFQINEAVHVSGLSRTTLYELIRAGKLKAIQAAGRRLVLKADLEAFLTSCREAT